MKRLQTPLLSTSILGLAILAMAIATGATLLANVDNPYESRAYLHSYNLPASGIAMEGYCPVSYFLADHPVLGKPEFASTYNGVTYYFAQADAKALFDKNPEKYLPAYGGWCAFGMANEDKFPVDPTNFKIVDGRLMLFLRNANVDALALWNQNDEQAQVVKANAHWMKVSR